MSAPSNNDGDRPIFSPRQLLPRPNERASDGSPGLRVVGRDGSISSPLNPAQPASQVPTLRPVSLVPPARPILAGTRELIQFQRRILDGHRTMSGPLDTSSSSQTMAQMQALEETARQLHETDRRLTAALELTSRLLGAPIQDLDSVEPHPPKRRRLEVDPTEGDEKPTIYEVKYGYEGAVVAGKLNMALQYCDGGVFEEGVCCPEHNVPRKEFFGVQNIFKDDKSVYCTKDSRCNIIIQHEGARPFTMKELIIKAPKSGYTSPVKEGMVFVGMDVDELLLRTAEYKIQYDKEKQKKRHRVASVRYLPDGSTRTVHHDCVTFAAEDSAAIIPEAFIGEDEGYKVETFCNSDAESSDDDASDEDHPWHSEAHDEYLLDGLVARQRRQALAEGRLGRVQQNVGNALWNRAQNGLGDDDDEDDSDPQDEDDDEDDSGQWGLRQASRAARERRRARGEDLSDESEEDEDEESDDDDDEDDEEDETISSYHIDSEAESINDLADASVVTDSNSTEQASTSGNAGEPKMLQARARFSISRGKSTCRMVFEPAISARFVLLKLYCPDAGGKRKRSRRGNIDVRNVTVKGWCGPRMFQDTELR